METTPSSRCVYIAGQVTGLDYEVVKETFDTYEKHLRNAGFDVINPLTKNGVDGIRKPYKFYMRRGIHDLTSGRVTDLGLMPGWEESGGVLREMEVAGMCGIPISDIVIGKDGATLVEHKETVLMEAERLVNGARQSSYGHPLDNCNNVAAMWSVIISKQVSAEDVAMCMAALKLCRNVHAHKRDNIVDCAGYMALIEMIDAERKRRENGTKDATVCHTEPK